MGEGKRARGRASDAGRSGPVDWRGAESEPGGGLSGMGERSGKWEGLAAGSKSVPFCAVRDHDAMGMGMGMGMTPGMRETWGVSVSGE